MDKPSTGSWVVAVPSFVMPSSVIWSNGRPKQRALGKNMILTVVIDILLYLVATLD